MEMFTADLHLGHEGILASRACFSSVAEMDAALIDNINRRMGRADTLYILGDLFVSAAAPAYEVLSSIKPKKVLIRGNHDSGWLRRITEEQLALSRTEVHRAFAIKRNHKELHMAHFPALAWSRSHFFAESLMLSGHIHARREGTVAAELFPLVRCRFNAGADVNGFMPVTLVEMIENNRDFYNRSYTDEEWAALMTTAAALTV